MSFTELEEKVRTLNADERLKLRNLLEQIRMENDVEWQEEMARRSERMIAGEEVSLEDLEKLHEELSRQGR